MGTVESVKPEKDSGIMSCNRKEAESGEWQAVIVFDKTATANAAKLRVEELRRDGTMFIRVTDRFTLTCEEPPRGQTRMALTVDRATGPVNLDFRPRTVTLFPTQLYETISMLLLIALLLAYQPFRRHEGQLFVLWLICYGIHRFLNEAIRIEPTYKIFGIDVGLTASQWISVGIILGGIVLEMVLRKIQKPLVTRGS
jgi:prolipoprotein diacylglyceryltransferase